MQRSSLSISNIVLSETEVDADATPKASYYRDALMPNAVPVLLRVRRVRVTATALCLTAAVAGLTYAFHHGVTLKSIDDVSAINTQARRESLVQDYNAYVGVVAALSVKPLQVLTATVLPVWLWCFLTESVMSADAKRSVKVKVFVFGVTSALLWLLSNAFFGINVQLVYSNEQDEFSMTTATTGFVNASDFQAPNASGSTSTDDSSSSPLNSILRSAITTDYRPARSACARTSPQGLSANVEYGFPTRDWMKEAAKAVSSSATVEVKARLGGKLETTTELPLETRSARSLSAYSFQLMEEFFLSSAEKGALKTNVNASLDTFTSESSSSMSDLLSNINTMFSSFAASAASSRVQWFDIPNVKVAFASSNLSSGASFESVSFDIPFVASYMQQRLTLANDTTSAVSYENIKPNASNPSVVDYLFDINIKESCGEHACIVTPRGEIVTDAPVDSGAQVRALPICLNSDGSEDVTATLQFNTNSPACSSMSNSSFLVFSFAQRVEGESFNQTTREIVQLQNAKKYYAVTVGRLSWKTVDLATVLGASCTAGSDCNGAALRLKENTMVAVSSNALPLQSFATSSLSASTWTTLAATNAYEIDSGNSLKSDLILPTLFSTSSAFSVGPTQCEVQRGNLLASITKKHLYSLQSNDQASTTALLWLFQDGVVKSVDSSSTTGSAATGSTSTSTVARLVVQVPRLSAILTYCGCTVVLLLAVSVLLFSKRHESRIEKFLTPYHLAQMLVGVSSALVPSPSLLRSDLLRVGGEDVGNSDQLDEFEILSLTLRHRRSSATLMQVPQLVTASQVTTSCAPSALNQV